MRVVDEKIGLERETEGWRETQGEREKEGEREMLMLSLPLASAAYLFVGCHELTLFTSQTSPPPPFHSSPLISSFPPLFWQDIKFSSDAAESICSAQCGKRDVVVVGTGS